MVDDIYRRSAQGEPGGRIRFVGMPLSLIIMPAYEVWDFQIIGGPGWIRTDPWDITAQAEGVEGRLKMDQERPMLRAMLEDRFQLKTHRETKRMLGYSLVVDGRGLKLKPYTDGKASTQNDRTSLEARKVAMTWFTAFLDQKLQRTVVDNTGLTGEFDFNLKWSLDSVDSSNLPAPDGLNSDAPSLFTALKEQLGLRLVPQTVTTDVLVIDSVQQPSPN